jgi:serine/threonine-protein kinase
MIGEALGSYTITAKLGSGTMGVVFRGEHARIARTAAIKILAPELVPNASAVQRCFTEARATSLIRHPGIVDVFDCDVDDTGRAYNVMEHLEGETLTDRLRRTDRFPWLVACEIARQVAAAIAAAHDRGIIHRHLKPDNVFLLRDPADSDRIGAVEVLDFGIAKLLAADVSARLTMRGMVLGTPEYMAPKQCGGRSDEIDARADIYALGCILFEMLSSEPPFVVEAIPELMLAHTFHPVPSIGERIDWLPGWLTGLVTDMLAKQRDDRPASMHSVAAALAEGTKVASAAAGVARSRRAGRRATVAVVGAGLTAVGAAVWIGGAAIRRLSQIDAPPAAPVVEPAIAREVPPPVAVPPVAVPPVVVPPGAVNLTPAVGAGPPSAPAVLPARKRARATERPQRRRRARRRQNTWWTRMASSIFERARRPAIAAAVIVLVAVVFGAPAAHAQPSAANDATRAAARGQLVDGVSALKRGDYQLALARFEQAYALVPSPKIHYDFGLAYVGLGRKADALAAFERFLAEAADAPSDKREKAASFVSTLRAEVGATAGRGDREAAGPPQTAPPAAAAGGRADSSLSSPVDAELAEYRDDGAAPAPGPDPLRSRRVAAVSLAAAGASLVAAGVVFGVLARGESDSLTHDSQIATADKPTPFDPSKESRGVTYQRLQIAGLVAGAVAVAAGAVVYATTRHRVTVEPVAGNAVAGANLRLTF